ncbi:MAG: PEP-CTERM sorting domain-containing protein [Pirellulales bacterium]
MKPLTLALSVLAASLAARLACEVRAATISFDDLPIGALAVPGSFQSGGVAIDLSGPGEAFIEHFGAPNQWLRMHLSSAASINVPGGTTSANFLASNSTSGSFVVNGHTRDFFGMPAIGVLDGVSYTLSSTPDPRLYRIDLVGPISTFGFISGPTLNALLIDEITLVPEPASWLLLFAGAALVAAGSRYRSLQMLRASGTGQDRT